MYPCTLMQEMSKIIFAFQMHISCSSMQNKIEIIIRTTKELLYLEDALGHEKYFQTKCSETANQIQDADLKSCVQQMAQKHQQIFQSFYGLL